MRPKISFALRPLTIAATLLVGATFGPLAALSQPADRQQQIITSIQKELRANGPYSADLLDPLRSLSLLYQESGRHDLAAATLEQALQVVRANQGLRSLDQAPLIRQRIHNAEAIGDVTEAWHLEQDLLALAKAHPEDLRTVPILEEVGDRRMELLERYLAGAVSPQVVLGCFYAPERGGRSPAPCNAGSREVAIQSILSDAQQRYLDAIRIMLRNQLYSSDELKDLEAALVESSYAHGRYDVGRQGLRRLLAYEAVSSGSLLSQMDAFVQIADWDLMFEFARASALESYSEAYELLERHGAAGRAAIESLFAPPTPVVLPAFLPNPLESAPTSQVTGYIDIAFDITQYGRSRSVEILDTTTNASDAAKGELVALITQSRFRPRMADGRLVRAAPVVVRHYLSE